MLKYIHYIISLGLISLASIIQLDNISYINGVKPNLAIVLIFILAMIHRSWPIRVTIILLSALILRPETGISVQNITFIIISLGGIALIDYLPWGKIFNFIIVIIFSALVVNLENFVLKIFIFETFYNLIIFGIIYLVIYSFYEKDRSTF